MLFKLGRILQIAGMLILPVGMVGNMYDQRLVSVQESLTIAGVGIVVFCVGWLLQQAARPR